MSSSSQCPSQIDKDALARSQQIADVLERLRCGAPIPEAACVVAAHPDDETIFAGARLCDLQDLTLIHITDGAPDHGEGPIELAEYRDRRKFELQEALERLGIRAHRLEFGLRDQTASFHLAEVTRWLVGELSGTEIVITHPYEGGHPDHDSAAFAVQSACRLLEDGGAHAPIRLEFACYHLQEGRRATGSFPSDPECASVQAELSQDRLERKNAALSCFRSQQEVIAWFEPEIERYRAAPLYDFHAAPGPALYDLWNWPLNSRTWQARAASALGDLGLAGGR
jgi:LmbE family N-acetylglucosaminyl deacetylase